MNTSKLAALIVAAILAFQCGDAKAVSTVIVGGYTYQCQHTCVVSSTSSGWVVSDSDFGWVQMMVKGKAIPVPQAIKHDQPLDSSGD
jgi:hypothetical protein